MDSMDSTLEKEEPVSPISHYLNSSILCVSIIAILEFQVPLNTMDLSSIVRDVFLPINPRFSSIMVTKGKGEKKKKKWKRVNVKIEDHIKDPIFPPNLTTESYKTHFDNYLTDISMEQFRPDKPLWEFHLFKYPTSKSVAGTLILKLNHSLGDGYSLMGVVLSCLRRASDPVLPLTFVSKRQPPGSCVVGSGFKYVPRILSSVFRTVLDLGEGVFKRKDDESPIRYGRDGVEFLPATLSTVVFSLDDIKLIKTKLGVSVNDAITGIISLGMRLYMEKTKRGSGRDESSILIVVNMRMIGNYKSATEMVTGGDRRKKKGLWGNQISYLRIMIPKMSDAKFSNPLEFIKEAHQSIKNKKKSFIVHFIAHSLHLVRKLRGHEKVAKILHKTMKNSSTVISNVIGPIEQMAFNHYLINGLYFTIVGTPQSLVTTVFSYMGNLRVAFRTQNDFIDSQKLNVCMEDAFEKILKATKELSANKTVN